MKIQKLAQGNILINNSLHQRYLRNLPMGIQKEWNWSGTPFLESYLTFLRSKSFNFIYSLDSKEYPNIDIDVASYRINSVLCPYSINEVKMRIPTIINWIDSVVDNFTVMPIFYESIFFDLLFSSIRKRLNYIKYLPLVNDEGNVNYSIETYGVDLSRDFIDSTRSLLYSIKLFLKDLNDNGPDYIRNNVSLYNELLVYHSFRLFFEAVLVESESSVVASIDFPELTIDKKLQTLMEYYDLKHYSTQEYDRCNYIINKDKIVDIKVIEYKDISTYNYTNTFSKDKHMISFKGDQKPIYEVNYCDSIIFGKDELFQVCPSSIFNQLIDNLSSKQAYANSTMYSHSLRAKHSADIKMYASSIECIKNELRAFLSKKSSVDAIYTVFRKLFRNINFQGLLELEESFYESLMQEVFLSKLKRKDIFKYNTYGIGWLLGLASLIIHENETQRLSSKLSEMRKKMISSGKILSYSNWGDFESHSIWFILNNSLNGVINKQLGDTYPKQVNMDFLINDFKEYSDISIEVYKNKRNIASCEDESRKVEIDNISELILIPVISKKYSDISEIPKDCDDNPIITLAIINGDDFPKFFTSILYPFLYNHTNGIVKPNKIVTHLWNYLRLDDKENIVTEKIPIKKETTPEDQKGRSSKNKHKNDFNNLIKSYKNMLSSIGYIKERTKFSKGGKSLFMVCAGDRYLTVYDRARDLQYYHSVLDEDLSD